MRPLSFKDCERLFGRWLFNHPQKYLEAENCQCPYGKHGEDDIPVLPAMQVAGSENTEIVLIA
jgi:hypothetical protein